MFATKALATLLIAAVPLTAATYATAAPGDYKGAKQGKYKKYKKQKSNKSLKSYSIKKKHGNKVTTTSVKQTRKGYVSTKRTTTTSRNGNKKTTIITKYVTQPFKKAYKNNFGLKDYRAYWPGRQYGNGHKKRKCVAAAKTRFGYGKRVWGIKGKKFGRNACDRAMNECRRELRHRKSTGRNPNARCVIIKRS